MAGETEVYYTLDSGATWTLNVPSAGMKYRSVFFYDDTTVFLQGITAVGASSMWRRSFSLPGVNSAVYTSSTPYLYLYTYPSPATDGVIHCDLRGLYAVSNVQSLSVRLVDLLGRPVQDLAGSARTGISGQRSQFDMDVSSLPNGTYFVQITTANGSIVKPVVLAR